MDWGKRSPFSLRVLGPANLATEGLHILAVRMTDAQYIRMEGKSSSVLSKPMLLTPRSPARRWIVTFRLHIGTRCSMHMTREGRPHPIFDSSPHFSIASMRTPFYRFGGNMRLPRFRRVREEKSGKLYEGGYHGKTPTKLYKRI